MLKRAITIIIVAAGAMTMHGQTAVRFGNEVSDTTMINELLESRGASQNFANAESRVALFARSFEGTPYGSHTLEGDPEMLTVRLDSLDCTTFVETAMALAYTSMESRRSWRDFVYNLQRMRYRGAMSTVIPRACIIYVTGLLTTVTVVFLPMSPTTSHECHI